MIAFSARRLIVCLFLWSPFIAAAQNTPACFQLFFPSIPAAPGDTVCLPLMVRDFDQIASMQFSINWDSSALSLVGVDISNSALNDLNPSSYSHLTPEKLLLSWNASSLMGISLSDSATIFRLCFRVSPNAFGFSAVSIGDLAPLVNYEVVQMLPPDWHIVYMPLAQQIGGVLIGSGGAGHLAVSSTCATGATCSTFNGAAAAQVTGGQPPYTFQWSGPNGFSAATPTISNVAGGNYRLTVTDQLNDQVMAEIRVSTSYSYLYLTHQLTPATCQEADGCATLTVVGGQPPFVFDWSEGAGHTPQHCQLAAGQHSATVTDALGCSATTSFQINAISNFSVNAYATHIETCGSKGSATAYPTGSGPFQYLWSNGDTTATATGLSQGFYWVIVTNPSGCTAMNYVDIYNLPVKQWALSYPTTCHPTLPNTGSILLNCHPEGLNHFPMQTVWSNGTIRTIPSKPSGNRLDSLTDVPSGIYTVTISDSAGCSITLNTWIDCAEPPPATQGLTGFYIKDDYLNTHYAIDSCAGVYARNFTGFETLSFSLDYAGAELRNIRKLGLPGLSYADFTFSPNGDKLGVYWTSVDGPVTLPGDSMLFEVCFDRNNTPGKSVTVEFGNDPVDVQLIDGHGVEQAFIGRDGYVMFDLYFPLQPSVCNFGILPPDCIADGKSRVVLEQCNPGLSFQSYCWSVSNSYNAPLQLVPAGEYSALAIQAASNANYFFIKIPDELSASGCVWPGDADNNDVVNHFDLLYLGLAYGAQGPARANATLAWQGQDASDWSTVTTERAVNYKNIDTNGDGSINAADTTAIVQNWNRVIHPWECDAFGPPQQNFGHAVQPALTINADTLRAGESVRLPLLLGSVNMPLDSIYGLAFSISYDPNALKDPVRFIPSNSWFGDSSQYLYIQKNYPEHGHLDVAITRTDHVPVSGWGPIGDLFIIIEDNIFVEPAPVVPSDTTLKTMLYFNGLRTLNAKEKAKPLDTHPVELVIYQPTSAVHSPTDWDRNIAVFPNPAAEVVRLESRGPDISRIEVLDVAGRLIWQTETNEPTLQIPVKNCPNGVVFVRIFTEKGVCIRKVNILH